MQWRYKERALVVCRRDVTVARSGDGQSDEVDALHDGRAPARHEMGRLGRQHLVEEVDGPQACDPHGCEVTHQCLREVVAHRGDNGETVTKVYVLSISSGPVDATSRCSSTP